MNNLNLKSTKDYSLFKIHNLNREVSRDRVKRLAEEMKIKNLLHLYPIVIDQDGVILDGQHRFEAAKSIESEIYYVQSENDYQISDVSKSNSMQRAWRTVDHIHFHAKNGNPHYIEIIDLSWELGVDPELVIWVMGKNRNDVKKGDFVITDEGREITRKVLQHADMLGDCFSYNKHRPFLNALKTLLLIPDYNPMRMVQKASCYPELCKKQVDSKEYLRVLETIYNKNANKPVRLF
jgi:hypothetical protein